MFTSLFCKNERQIRWKKFIQFPYLLASPLNWIACTKGTSNFPNCLQTACPFSSCDGQAFARRLRYAKSETVGAFARWAAGSAVSIPHFPNYSSFPMQRRYISSTSVRWCTRHLRELGSNTFANTYLLWFPAGPTPSPPRLRLIQLHRR